VPFLSVDLGIHEDSDEGARKWQASNAGRGEGRSAPPSNHPRLHALTVLRQPAWSSLLNKGVQSTSPPMTLGYSKPRGPQRFAVVRCLVAITRTFRRLPGGRAASDRSRPPTQQRSASIWRPRPSPHVKACSTLSPQTGLSRNLGICPDADTTPADETGPPAHQADQPDNGRPNDAASSAKPPPRPLPQPHSHPPTLHGQHQDVAPPSTRQPVPIPASPGPDAPRRRQTQSADHGHCRASPGGRVSRINRRRTVAVPVNCWIDLNEIKTRAFGALAVCGRRWRAVLDCSRLV
jgi:hypothetical protein